MSTRTRNTRTKTKTTQKKPTPRKPLPVRKRHFMTDTQGHAVLAARIAGITTPHINEWTDHHDGTATRALTDGTLHYHHPTRTLTWQATCRMGAVHTYAITNPGLAHTARILAATCTQIHHDLTHIERLTADEQAELGILHTPTWAIPIPGEPPTESVPVPLPDRRERALGDTLTHSTTTTTDTKPYSPADIAAALAEPTTTDTPKEHPQP